MSIRSRKQHNKFKKTSTAKPTQSPLKDNLKFYAYLLLQTPRILYNHIDIIMACAIPLVMAYNYATTVDHPTTPEDALAWSPAPSAPWDYNSTCPHI